MDARSTECVTPNERTNERTTTRSRVRRRRATVEMPPFLGGMRGLTVFVQDVRNCSNKVRIDLDLDDATRATRMNHSFIHSFFSFSTRVCASFAAGGKMTRVWMGSVWPAT